MAHIVIDSCVKDLLCLDACPSEAIHPTKDEAGFDAATQVFINPELCMDCGACVATCPSNAIFPADDVPADKADFVQKNTAYFA